MVSVRKVNGPLAHRREEGEARGGISDYIYSTGGKVLYSRAHKMGFGAKCTLNSETQRSVKVR